MVLTRRIREIHWSDIAIIGIFFAILTIAFFFFLRRVEYITLRLRISQSDGLKNYLVWDMPPLWYTTVLKPGMEDTDFLGRSAIKIEKIIAALPEDNEQRVYVDLKIQALYNKQTKQYSYNGVPLLIGSYQKFKVNEIQIPGVIHAIGELGATPYPQKKFVLHGFLDQRYNEWLPGITNSPTSLVEYNGVYRHISERIVESMEMKYGDQIVAKILTIKRSPAVKTVIQLGRIFYIADPQRERVELTVETTASMINDRPYFKDDQQRILINSQIALDFNLIKPIMTITDIEEK